MIQLRLNLLTQTADSKRIGETGIAPRPSGNAPRGICGSDPNPRAAADVPLAKTSTRKESLGRILRLSRVASSPSPPAAPPLASAPDTAGP